MNKLSLPASVALLVALSSGSWAFECPAPSTIGDAASVATVGQYLPADTDLNAPDALQSAVFELQHAGVSDDLILDNLIAVYCGAVAGQDASDDDKTSRIEVFSKSATQVVFGDVD